MKRGYGEMYTRVVIVGVNYRSPLPRANDIFLFSDLKNVSYVHNHLLLLP